jgi:hypothetical protein
MQTTVREQSECALNTPPLGALQSECALNTPTPHIAFTLRIAPTLCSLASLLPSLHPSSVLGNLTTLLKAKDMWKGAVFNHCYAVCTLINHCYAVCTVDMSVGYVERHPRGDHLRQWGTNVRQQRG